MISKGKMSAAGENFDISGSQTRILKGKMSAAGENFDILGVPDGNF